MLTEIHCNKFRINPIRFHSGLNVVLGDEKASNSIGKSMLLMIIDFAMGGNSFLEVNKDVVLELGHHEYYFSFTFDKSTHRFCRTTDNANSVIICNNDYNHVKSISIDDYRSFLFSSYNLNYSAIKFRTVVSLYSRIWGKENLEPRRPLESHKKEKIESGFINILSLYDEYDNIKDMMNKYKSASNRLDSIKKAFQQDLITKITKSQYSKNRDSINVLTADLADIKDNLSIFATNINSLTNSKVLSLKSDKDSLLSTKIDLESRLERIDDSIKNNRHIKSKYFQPLVEYFPSINQKKIAQVEEFHSEISTILKNELRQSKKSLNQQLNTVNELIAEIDKELKSIFSEVDNPTILVDTVVELTNKLNSARNECLYYERYQDAKELKEQRISDLLGEKLSAFDRVGNSINESLRELTNIVYSPSKQSPHITFSDKNYDYKIQEDTGAGKAFSNLILFDWSVFTSTELPFIIHDSILFKNIENATVSEIISLYSSFDIKQSFISIDESNKYGNITAASLKKNSVLELSDSSVLYTKDWKNKN